MTTAEATHRQPNILDLGSPQNGQRTSPRPIAIAIERQPLQAFCNYPSPFTSKRSHDALRI